MNLTFDFPQIQFEMLLPIWASKHADRGEFVDHPRHILRGIVMSNRDQGDHARADLADDLSFDFDAGLERSLQDGDHTSVPKVRVGVTRSMRTSTDSPVKSSSASK